MNCKKESIKVRKTFLRLFISSALAFLLFIAEQTYCFATTITLQWDSISGATGYKVHCQADSSTQPFPTANTIDVQTKTTTSISGLDPAHTFYFAVTAYNATEESNYSNVVSVPELTPPTVTAFTLPSIYTALTVPINIFTATDNVGVTGYCVTLTNSSSGCSWSSSAPSSVTFSSYGIQTAYAWAKDASGNISDAKSSSVTITADTTPPTVTLTAPYNGSALRGTAMISATASDNSGVVSRVEFYIDTTPLYTTNVSPYSYSWNTNSVADGSYTLYAKAYDTAGNFGQSSISVTVSNIAITVPGTPTNVSATAGNAQATVSFSAPASNGGSAITSYTVTSSAGKTATGTASPITVTGLTNGTAYTFNVTATNSAGTGPPSAASNSVTPSTSPVRAVSFSSISPTSPRTVGTSVTFNSSASGGSRSYQYQFLVKRAVVSGTWTTARVYSLSPSFTWSTSGLSKGTYYIQVQARNIGSTASYEASKTITYRLK